MNKLLIILVMWSFCLASVAGEPKADGRAVGTKTSTGAGMLSCGVHIAGSDEQKKMDSQWVIGYLVARNLYGKVDILKNVDVASLSAAVDSYCAKNPLELIFGATGAIYENLLVIQKR